MARPRCSSVRIVACELRARQASTGIEVREQPGEPIPLSIPGGMALVRLPRRVIIYAVEGEDFTAGKQLSAAARAALPNVTRAVLEEASRLRDGR